MVKYREIFQVYNNNIPRSSFRVSVINLQSKRRPLPPDPNEKEEGLSIGGLLSKAICALVSYL